MGLALGLESGLKVRPGRGLGTITAGGRRPRRTDVVPGATEAALVGGVARPLQADHEAGAKGSGASFELGGGQGGRDRAERGEGDQHEYVVRRGLRRGLRTKLLLMTLVLYKVVTFP